MVPTSTLMLRPVRLLERDVRGHYTAPPRGVSIRGTGCGLVHIREIADIYVKDVRDYLKEQEKVKVKVLGLNERGKLDLSVKQALSPEERAARARAKTSFEDKLKAFMK